MSLGIKDVSGIYSRGSDLVRETDEFTKELYALSQTDFGTGPTSFSKIQEALNVRWSNGDGIMERSRKLMKVASDEIWKQRFRYFLFGWKIHKVIIWGAIVVIVIVAFVQYLGVLCLS